MGDRDLEAYFDGDGNELIYDDDGNIVGYSEPYVRWDKLARDDD